MICAWCGQSGSAIDHHYPLQKRDGGTETVKICPNCHQFVHQGLLINATEARDESSYEAVIEETTLKAIRERLPLLWNLGEFYDPFTKKVVLNPYWKFKEARGAETK